MKRKAERKVVCVTPEDHEFIEQLYKRITDEYVSLASKAGVRPTIGKKGQGPKMRHVISFLREHVVYGNSGDKEICCKVCEMKDGIGMQDFQRATCLLKEFYSRHKSIIAPGEVG